MTPEATIGGVEALLDDLMSRFGDTDVVWFRGHADAAWALQPSLARRAGLGIELDLMAEFKRDATPLVDRADLREGDLSEWDSLFLMQHYGVPTRLLDWSESPLSALFFAIDECDSPDRRATHACGLSDRRSSTGWQLVVRVRGRSPT